MKKLISVLLIYLLAANSKSIAAQTKQNDARPQEMEKAIFMAAGSQNRVLRIGLVDCVAYALKNNSEVKI
ncbi:MAG: hypothetical protein QME65_04075, partial [Candidatus Omnitrophota bacterium]|nr:hypothetical protein [Candidatus Omnitrophota bacterium]